MAKYKITFKKSVAKDLRGIPNQQVASILKRIEKLSDNPRAEGCIKLSGLDKCHVRRGLYRIVYEIIDTRLVVQIVKVGHRSSVYDS